MSKARTLFVSMFAALALVGPANAAPPTLLSVGHDGYHPTATFSAPAADSVTVYIASSMDRATDGSFLSENIAESGWLTDFEITSGRWLDADMIASGHYYVMLGASSYTCPDGADCADGYSNILPLTVAARTLSRSIARSAIHDVMAGGRFAREYEAVAYSSYDPDPIRRCARLSRLRVRCNLSWALGDAGYSGKATVIRRAGEEDRVRWTLRVTNCYCLNAGRKRCSRTYRGG